MKLYKCDSCGRIMEEKYNEDLFMEGGWTKEFFDENDNPIKIDLESPITSIEKIKKVKHYCPECTYYPLYVFKN